MKLWIAFFLAFALPFSCKTPCAPKACIASQVKLNSPGARVNVDTKKVAHLLGPVTLSSVRKAASEILEAESVPGPLVLIIQSPGGSVGAGALLIKDIQREQQQGTKVICVAVNDAHSMAFDILSFCDVRLMTPHTLSVVHKAAASILDERDGRLTAKKLREIANEIEELDAPYRIQNAKKMHLSLNLYDKYADAERTWTAEELLDMGYLQGLAILQPSK
jgi:ATP-dependent protease ClpP protease subunit